jgi:hypothetical protein
MEPDAIPNQFTAYRLNIPGADTVWFQAVIDGHVLPSYFRQATFDEAMAWVRRNSEVLTVWSKKVKTDEPRFGLVRIRLYEQKPRNCMQEMIVSEGGAFVFGLLARPGDAFGVSRDNRMFIYAGESNLIDRPTVAFRAGDGYLYSRESHVASAEQWLQEATLEMTGNVLSPPS